MKTQRTELRRGRRVGRDRTKERAVKAAGLKPQILPQRKLRPKNWEETMEQFQPIRNIFLITQRHHKVENIQKTINSALGKYCPMLFSQCI